MLQRPRELGPGLLVVVAVAAAAWGFHHVLPPAPQRMLGEVVFAVGIGLLVGNLIRLPAACAPGIRFGFGTLLRAAIVLLGARLSLHEVARIGGKALVMIVLLMTLALVVSHFLGRALGVPPKLASLIGIGTSVCGNSAISATAPVIAARDDEVSFAIATNTVLGTLAVFAYPLIGRALGFDAATYGTWVGTAVNDTSQVVAAGFALGERAGEVATTVKLVRNALIGPVILLMGFLYATPAAGGDARPATFGARLRQSVPGFVLGFLTLAFLRSVGALDQLSALIGVDVVAACGAAAKVLILAALAAVGLSTDGRALVATGPRPFYLGLIVALLGALASLLLIQLLGPAAG
jgi:uncharacterized integral membrane protein (TIGR00698 family)